MQSPCLTLGDPGRAPRLMFAVGIVAAFTLSGASAWSADSSGSAQQSSPAGAASASTDGEEQRLLEALRDAEAQHGGDADGVLLPLLRLAKFYGGRNRHRAALEVLHRALQIEERKYGTEHVEIAATLDLIGNRHADLAEYAQALPTLRRSLAIREKVLPAAHPDVATSLNTLAELYRVMGQYAQALPLLQRSLSIREEALGPEHRLVATSLNNLGVVYKAGGQYEQALSAYQRSLGIQEKIYGPEHPNVAATLNNLGLLFEATGQHAQALALYQRSLAVREKVYGPEHPDVALSLNSLANHYKATGQYAQALPILRRSLAIRQKVLSPEHKDVAQSLNSLALLYYAMGEYAEAVPLYQGSLVILEKVLGPDHPEVATILDNLAELYRAVGQYAQALLTRQRSLAIREKVLGPEHPAVAISLNNLGVLYKATGRYEQALSVHQRSLAILEKTYGPEHQDVATSLHNLADLYEARGQYGQALPIHQRSLAIFEKALGPEHPNVATSLNGLASLYQVTGRYAQALSTYQRSLAILEKVLGPDHSDVATSLNNVAGLYAAMGQYAVALPAYERSLAILEKVLGPDHPDVATSLNNVAGLYAAMGQYAVALPAYERSLAIQEKAYSPEHRDVARSLNNLAEVYKATGQYALGLPAYQRSLAILEKALGPEHPDVAAILNNIAGLHLILGQHPQALTAYERSLSIREKALDPEHPDLATSLNDLALLQRAMGQYAQARPLAHRALPILMQSRRPESLWRVQRTLAEISSDQGEIESALFWDKQAINTIQGLRAGLSNLDRTLQQSFLSNKRYVYTGLAERLIGQGRLPEAQQVMAMLKEEEFFDFVRRDAAEDSRSTQLSLTGVERRAHERFYAIHDELAALGSEREVLARKEKSGELREEERIRAAAIEADLEKARLAFDAFLGGLVQSLRADPELAGSAKATQQRIQSHQNLLEDLNAAGQGVAALQYVGGEKAVHIILTTPALQLAREYLIARTTLNAKIAAFRQTLQDPRVDPRPLGRELYQILIAPIAKDLQAQGVDTLMLFLDGALRYVPFAALTEEGDRYLVERYRLALFTEAAQSRLSQPPKETWRVAALGVTQAHPGFSALPAVQDELQGIVSDGVLPGEVYLDERFTLARLQASLGNPVLHIASHFKFVPGSDASYLLLGDGSRLTLQELKAKGMRFTGVDLLTLSACETAIGGGLNENGLEVEGLGALAQRQGARGVLASLWPVADASTGQWMQYFYRLRQQNPRLTKAEVLRLTQIAFIRGRQGASDSGTRRDASPGGLAPQASPLTDEQRPAGLGGYSHPYYWAPFILMGNWL